MTRPLDPRRSLLDDLWRDLAGLTAKPRPAMPSLAELRETEWSPEFEQLMRNRLLIGAFRYGRFGDPEKTLYDHISSIRRRLDAYERTGNTEHLVDVANLAMVEFVVGKHPTKHFHAIDGGEHCRMKDRSCSKT